MRKKDFETIAQAIKDAREALLWGHDKGDGASQDKDTNRAFNGLARDVSRVLATTNPKFDKNRFLIGCGVE